MHNCLRSVLAKTAKGGKLNLWAVAHKDSIEPDSCQSTNWLQSTYIRWWSRTRVDCIKELLEACTAEMRFWLSGKPMISFVLGQQNLCNIHSEVVVSSGSQDKIYCAMYLFAGTIRAPKLLRPERSTQVPVPSRWRGRTGIDYDYHTRINPFIFCSFSWPTKSLRKVLGRC